MTIITEKEAIAFGIKIDAVSEQEMLVKGAMTGLAKRLGYKFDNQQIKQPKKPRQTLEDNDAERLCSRLKNKDHMFVHTPNESGIGGKHAMLVGLKKKRMGLMPGYPDFTIYNHNGCTTYIELKKRRTKKLDGEYKALSSDGIHCSDEQKKRICFLQQRPLSFASFCFGFDEAVKFIETVESTKECFDI